MSRLDQPCPECGHEIGDHEPPLTAGRIGPCLDCECMGDDPALKADA